MKKWIAVVAVLATLSLSGCGFNSGCAPRCGMNTCCSGMDYTWY